MWDSFSSSFFTSGFIVCYLDLEPHSGNFPFEFRTKSFPCLPHVLPHGFVCLRETVKVKTAGHHIENGTLLFYSIVEFTLQEFCVCERISMTRFFVSLQCAWQFGFYFWGHFSLMIDFSRNVIKVTATIFRIIDRIDHRKTALIYWLIVNKSVFR